MSTLAERTRFEPAEVEPRIAERWIASGLHHPETGGTPAENYSIAIPPPNVTGVLHMGHALNGSVQDTRSAISDLEVEDRDVTDTLFHVAYPLEDGSGEIGVATVRPETMLADTAVAVNPPD